MRLINNEAELLATQERIDEIIDKQNTELKKLADETGIKEIG